mgnify:CR=1 FL=1
MDITIGVWRSVVQFERVVVVPLVLEQLLHPAVQPSGGVADHFFFPDRCVRAHWERGLRELQRLLQQLFLRHGEAILGRGFDDLPQLKEIINAFSEISKIPTNNIQPSFQPIELKNVFRKIDAEIKKKRIVFTREEAIRDDIYD